jgi:hypothetical protein
MTDATWKKHPHSNDYNTGTNWTGSVVPDGIAFFGTSSVTHLFFSDTTTDMSVGSWTFKKGAPNYTFHFDAANPRFAFTGTGIVIRDSSVKIINDGDVAFLNASSAGKAHITNNTDLFFFEGTSTAGNAVITTTGNGETDFEDNSDGGKARLITQTGGVVDFDQGSGPLGDNKIHVGSIEGAGTYFLGNKILIVGSNNRSMTVSGMVSDGGFSVTLAAPLKKSAKAR